MDRARAAGALDNSIWGPDWPDVRALWSLDPARAHLNHGSFGAVPIPVQTAQQEIRRVMDANPTRFFWQVLKDALGQARRAVALFLRAEEDGVAFVPNATTAVSTVLASIELNPRDELLVTNQTYGAMRMAAERTCARTGASLVLSAVPLAARGPGDLRDAVLGGVTDRTCLAIVDHIASPTGLVFPIKELVTELRSRGVLVLVDGAHAPGTVDVDLRTLDPDFWTGNFHKWCCAPRGSAALYVREEHRGRVAPLVTSWPHSKGFPASFGYLGTDDYSSYLTVPAAISFMEGLGWQRVRAHNKSLARFGHQVVGEALGTLPKEPLVDDLFEPMRPVPLPPGAATTEDEAKALYVRVAEELQAELAVVAWEGGGYVRLSAQVYNAPAEYERLAEELPKLLTDH